MGPVIAEQVVDQAICDGGFAEEPVDLASVAAPMLSEPMQPKYGPCVDGTHARFVL